MSIRYLTATLLSLGLMQAAVAADAVNQQGVHGTLAVQSAEMSDGTVKKIDAAKGRLTIAHGPLKNLNMPPMTMVFRAAKPELLTGIAAGDRVRFVAKDDGGKMVVTAIEKAQ